MFHRSRLAITFSWSAYYAVVVCRWYARYYTIIVEYSNFESPFFLELEGACKLNVSRSLSIWMMNLRRRWPLYFTKPTREFKMARTRLACQDVSKYLPNKPKFGALRVPNDPPFINLWTISLSTSFCWMSLYQTPKLNMRRQWHLSKYVRDGGGPVTRFGGLIIDYRLSLTFSQVHWDIA